MKEYAIIVAGGTGRRMNSQLPKQFIQIAGKPILLHTIEAFYQYSKHIEIIVVLPADQHSTWNSICRKFHFDIPHSITSGGKSRFESVKNGLMLIRDENSVVAIHDGVRPFIKANIIKATFESAGKYGSGIAATPLKESIREKVRGTTISRDRNNYYSIQTPQTFLYSQIIKAYEVKEKSIFTDDASVAEDYGIPIYLVEGDYDNIKITTPEDVIIANAIAKKQKK